MLFVLSELLRPKPEMENAKPAGLGDFNFPTATEGRAVPLIWGTVRISGPNVVWYGDLRTVAIQENVKTGLFSSEDVTVGFRYFVGIQFALCRGPVDELRKVWVGDKVLFDRTGSPIPHDGTEYFNDPYFFGGDDVGGNGGMYGVALFKGGTETQSVASYLGNFQKIPPSTGDTPAYRGVCYVCPASSPFYVGNSAQIQPWKFEVRRIPDVIPDPGDPEGGGNGYYLLVNGEDANPAQVLYEVLTNTDWGLGFSHFDMDTQSFIDAANVCSGEGNGFSMILDQPQEASDLVRVIAEQMDAVVAQNQITGKWVATMIRPDADLPSTPPTPREIDSTNLISLESWTRGAWDGTVNQLLLEFFDRADEYKQTFAGAQDMGNIRIQDANVRSQIRYPGVKTADLANDLVWRELLTQSYPLAKATVKVDRTFWDTQIGSVVIFNDDTLGISGFVMRVASVNLGNLAEGEIRLELVEDIFRAIPGAFDVPGSGWDPVGELEAFVYQLAFESPRAFNARVFATPEEARIWGTGRRVGSESGYDSYARKAAEAYQKTGDSVGFVVLGKLKAALTKSDAVPWSPGTSFVVKPDPDDLDTLFDALDLTLSKNQVGSNLANLLLVGNEFVFVTAAAKVSGELQLNTVYRGAIDSVQEDHAVDDLVYILSAGGNVFPFVWDAGAVVDTKLLPKSLSGILDLGDATEIENTMNKRSRKPYPAVWYKLNNALLAYPASLDLEAGAGTWDTDGVDFDVSRRDYRLTDEVAQMEQDAALLATGFPAVEQHVTRYEVTKDYATVPVVLFTDEDDTTAWTVLRNLILRWNAGAVPASLQFRVYARHVDAAESLDSIQEYVIQIPTVTATSLTGLFNMGADSAGGVSNLFTCASTGTHTLRIQTAFANAIQYRVNGGGWLTLITGGMTTGTTAGETAGDTIELRHSETTVGLIQLAYLRDNIAAADAAYWVPYV